MILEHYRDQGANRGISVGRRDVGALLKDGSEQESTLDLAVNT